MGEQHHRRRRLAAQAMDGAGLVIIAAGVSWVNYPARDGSRFQRAVNRDIVSDFFCHGHSIDHCGRSISREIPQPPEPIWRAQ